MTVNLSIFCHSSGVTSSKVYYYSNTRIPFWMNSILLPLMPILHLRKNSKYDTKAPYLSVRYDNLYVNITSKFRFNPSKSLLQ